MNRELSMTANAIKKRRLKENPPVHKKMLNRNSTICGRSLFDNFLPVSEKEENVNCKICVIKIKKGYKLHKERTQTN
jgi:hypothetical protein